MKYVLFSCFAFFILMSISCTQNIDGISCNDKLTCYFFFIPDCPASANNIGKLNELTSTYGDDVEFIGVLSEPSFNRALLDSVITAYSINFKVIIDDSLKIASGHGASVTPELFLYGDKSELIYSGALDNYYYAVGKHRNKTTENYLIEAINSALNGTEVKIESTTAYGCRINLDYFNDK